MNFQPRPRNMYQPIRGGYPSRGRGGFRHSYQGVPTPQFKNNMDNQSGEFWCETCDRAFRSHILLQNHKKEHMKCSIDGCQFVAHPKVITKHIEMQHSTGLYNRIGNLDNPEAIKKWREERKKRYPTKENIDKKQMELKEKVNRGEKMGLQNRMKHDIDRNLRKRDHFKKNSSDRASFKRKPLDHNMRNKKQKKMEPEMIIPTEQRKLKPFAGIQNLSFSDDEAEVETTDISSIPIEEDEFELEQSVSNICNKDQKVSVCGALSSLIMNYDSSDDDEHGNQANSDELKPNNQTNNLNNVVSSRKQEALHPNVTSKTCNEVISKTSIPPEPVSTYNDNVEVTNVQINTKPIAKQSGSRENATANSQNGDSINKSESEDSGPEEIQSQKPTNNTKDLSINSIQNTTYRRKDKTLAPQHKRSYIRKTKLPSTLLVKLLSKEIRHERNVILQCIRHIVKNNYYKHNEGS